MRRTLDLAETAPRLDKIARARAKARSHAWNLIQDTPARFPWLEIAGKTLTDAPGGAVSLRSAHHRRGPGPAFQIR